MMTNDAPVDDHEGMAPEHSIATLVVAYSINMDASTGAFVGFGTLTGPSGMVILHPTTGSRLQNTTYQQKLRLQIADNTDRLQVVDGTVYLSLENQGVRLPPAVIPDDGVLAEASRAFWKIPPAELLALLTANEDHDPSTTPFPIPDPPRSLGEPGVHGPWCRIFPWCPGCR